MFQKIQNIIDQICENPKISSLLLGILATFALPPHYHLWSLFLSLGILSLILEKNTGKKRAFAIGYFFGLGFFSIGFSWVAHALALDLSSFGWLIPIALLASGAFFGLFSGIATYAANFFKGYYAKVIALAAFWAISEWIRSFFLTGFPWNLIGSVWTFDHLWIQTTSIIGTYGLSLLTILITCLPFSLFLPPHKKNAIIGICSSLCIIAFLFAFGYWRCRKLDNFENSPISLRIVQPSIPQSLKWDFGSLEDNLIEYISMSQSEGFADKNIIIWGETASTFPIKLDLTHFEMVEQAVPQNGYLISGSIDYSPQENDRWVPTNAAHIINKEKGIIDTYAKSHLVPFGEYIPLRWLIPASLRPITKTITDFMAGESPQTYHLKNIPPVGLLICYEIIFPHQVYNSADRPEWLINLTNDGWYGKSAGPYQHLASAQLRAAEEGLTIVRAANSGVSAIISRTGKIINSAPLHQKQNLDIYLPQYLSSPTTYSKYGNFAFFTIALFSLIIGAILSRKKMLIKEKNIDKYTQ